MIRVVLKKSTKSLIVDFVDDLRHQSADHSHDYDVNFGRFQLIQNLFVRLGMRMHVKPGKYIPPTTYINYIGFDFDSERMVIIVPLEKIEHAKSLIETVRNAYYGKKQYK